MGPRCDAIKRSWAAPALRTCRRRGLVLLQVFCCSAFLFDLHAIYPDNADRPGPQCLERAQASGNVQLRAIKRSTVGLLSFLILL